MTSFSLIRIFISLDLRNKVVQSAVDANVWNAHLLDRRCGVKGNVFLSRQSALSTCLIMKKFPLQIHSDQLTDLKRIDNYASIKLDRCIPLVGDVKIEFTCTQIIKHKQKLFHYWFNTFFVNEIPNCKLHIGSEEI